MHLRSALAERYSVDGSRKRGGDLDFFSHGQMAKPFEEAAFMLNKAQFLGSLRRSSATTS
ncbi:MAG: peptidylprolyl isomerase [Candidatus Micrarchaeaceae archaeon]